MTLEELGLTERRSLRGLIEQARAAQVAAIDVAENESVATVTVRGGDFEPVRSSLWTCSMERSAVAHRLVHERVARLLSETPAGYQLLADQGFA